MKRKTRMSVKEEEEDSKGKGRDNVQTKQCRQRGEEGEWSKRGRKKQGGGTSSGQMGGDGEMKVGSADQWLVLNCRTLKTKVVK